ncbi:MAG: hypothetical protein WKG07_44345 [Hymenobacter sp.]
MKLLLLLLTVGLAPAAYAQGSRAAAGAALYRAANARRGGPPPARRAEPARGGILDNGTYQVGYLRLLSGQRVLVPGLRYYIQPAAAASAGFLAGRPAPTTGRWPRCAASTWVPPTTTRRWCTATAPA